MRGRGSWGDGRCRALPRRPEERPQHPQILTANLCSKMQLQLQRQKRRKSACLWAPRRPPPEPDKLPLPPTSWLTVLRGAAGCRGERRAVRSSLCIQRRSEIFPGTGIALYYERCFLQSGSKRRRLRSFILSFSFFFFLLSEGTSAPLRKHLC